MLRKGSPERALPQEEQRILQKPMHAEAQERAPDRLRVSQDALGEKIDDVLADAETRVECFAVGSEVMRGGERWNVTAKDERGNVFLTREGGGKFAILPEVALQREIDAAVHIPELANAYAAVGAAELLKEDDATKDFLVRVLDEYHDEIIESAALTAHDAEHADARAILAQTIHDVKNDVLAAAKARRGRAAQIAAKERREMFLSRAERVATSGLALLRVGGMLEEAENTHAVRKGGLAYLEEAETTVVHKEDEPEISPQEKTPPRGIWKAKPIDSPVLYDAMVRGESPDWESAPVATGSQAEIQRLQGEIRLLEGVIEVGTNDPEGRQLARIARLAEFEDALRRQMMAEPPQPRNRRKGDRGVTPAEEGSMTAHVLRTELRMSRLTKNDVLALIEDAVHSGDLSEKETAGVQAFYKELTAPEETPAPAPFQEETIEIDEPEEIEEVATHIAEEVEDKPETMADVLTREAKTRKPSAAPRRVTPVDRRKKAQDFDAVEKAFFESAVGTGTEVVVEQRPPTVETPPLPPAPWKTPPKADIRPQRLATEEELRARRERVRKKATSESAAQRLGEEERAHDRRAKDERAFGKDAAEFFDSKPDAYTYSDEVNDVDAWFNADPGEMLERPKRIDTPAFNEILKAFGNRNRQFLRDFRAANEQHIINLTLEELANAPTGRFSWANPKHWGKKSTNDYIRELREAFTILRGLEHKQ